MILLEKQFSFAKSNNTSLTCLMIDADNFKEVNDTFGHDSGDKVLCLLSEIFGDHFRTDDNICRLGGDEFLVICPKTKTEGAMHIAEKLRKEINTLGLDIWDSSISVGIASISQETKSFMELIKNADTALYKAKDDGKNCVRNFDLI
jgi:hemerythrin